VDSRHLLRVRSTVFLEEKHQIQLEDHREKIHLHELYHIPWGLNEICIQDRLGKKLLKGRVQ
jgi:hypothetical protein